MIDSKYLTDLPAPQRAALETLLALDCDTPERASELIYDTQALRDLERVGLLSWDPSHGEQLTAAGRALVVELAHVDATREDLLRRVLAAKPSGRHRAEEFVDSFPEAAVEHTAELEAIGAPVSLAGWVRRNKNPGRVYPQLV
ncbi:hypothetical protein ABT266_36170 [Amycolatopsis sp. NPDC000746]|uniref:hypothetical protein n=1 Tax=Amycolatopsis sp. NPDC000746 TaxID=3154270 RepID=UPI00331C3004